MINCEEAREIIADALKVLIRGEEIEVSNLKAKEAFCHIRECNEKECVELWRKFDSIIRDFEEMIPLLKGEGSLAFD